MENVLVFSKYMFLNKLRKKTVPVDRRWDFFQKKLRIQGRTSRTAEEINREIYDRIQSGKPFMAGRLGGNELSAVRMFDFKAACKYQVVLDYLCNNAGFFPNDRKAGFRFKDLMIGLLSEVDVLGLSMLPLEDYYMNKYGSKGLITTHIEDLEPWKVDENPWSAALEGKKVLVIYPLAETIQKQYEKREKLFVGTDILPAFELKTLKAVQTIAGEKDDRFADWFEALEWMYQEALKIDFDIAIIGCGAYGFPLAAMLKKAGKQAFHLGGATQLMFGIKGKRWLEEGKKFAYVQRFMNDEWVFPSEKDRPRGAQTVEDACYW